MYVVNFCFLIHVIILLSGNLIMTVCSKIARSYGIRVPLLRFLRMLEKWLANEEDEEEGGAGVEKQNARK